MAFKKAVQTKSEKLLKDFSVCQEMSTRKLFFFICGFFIGILGWSLFYHLLFFESDQRTTNWVFRESSVDYDETLANEMFCKVKVVCLVMTHPDNHKTKAIHVKNTWGRKCNKLLFMSSANDSVLNPIVLPINDDREFLWSKTKRSFLYAYHNHFDDAEWFLKADDDSYLVMENLRYMLDQYDSSTSLYFGHRYDRHALPEGYMAGGGYILSKKALSNFVQELIGNNPLCHHDDTANEDFEMGYCLNGTAIPVDSRDEKYQKRFFPIGVEVHFENASQAHEPRWYFQYMFHNVTQGNLDCCSDKIVQMHYIDPEEMYKIEYLIYDVHPFGINNLFIDETFPVKLEMSEILQRSNSISFRQLRRKHKEDLLKHRNNTEDKIVGL